MPVEPVPCAAPEPEPPIPPCCSPGIASTGLCLGDGTPISVLAVSACGECGTDAAAPEVSGWLNLLTGAFTAGSPPAGTEACAGQPQQFEVGQWCDLDAAGAVIAPVLVEYEYDDDGQLIGVRTLTPAGDPYTVTGTLGICPGAVNDIEYVILCDTATDGTVVEFLRQLTPNGDGTSSTSDTLLDGTTPYVPVGRVGACRGSLVPCGTGTGGTPGVSGPITSGNEELSSVALSRPISPATEHEVPGMGALITGGTWHMPATKCGVQTSGQDHGLGALKLPAVPRPLCDAGTVQVTIRLTYAQEGPDVGQASTGALFLMYHQPDGSAVQAGGHAFPQNTPVGSTGVREVTAAIPADRLAAGQVYAVVSAETWQKSFNVAPRCKAWTFSEWSAEFAYDVTGCPDLPPPPLAQLVKVCPTDPIPVTVEPGRDTEVAVLCNTAEDGSVTEFLRAYQVDSASGQVGVVADTLLDGITPYEPLGEVGRCQPEPCRHCDSHVLCDVVPMSSSTIAGTAASGRLSNGVGWTARGPAAFAPSRQSDGAAWWGLGLFPNPTTPVTTWTFDQPVTAEFSVAMSYLAGAAAGGNTVQLPAGAQPLSLPPGYTFDRATAVLSADATVTGCPQIRTPSRETSARFRVTGVTSFALQYLGVRALVPECQVFGNWAFGAVDVSLGGQFLRTTCRDCQGEVLDVTDTTLDGTTAYTPTGTVGVCHPPEAEPCASTVETLRLCDLDPTVEPGDDGRRCAVPFLRHLVHDCTGALAETRDTAMDGTTPYTPGEVVDCGSGGVPGLRELTWPQSGITEDPAGVSRQDFIFTVTNPETSETAEVRLHTTSLAGGACGAYDVNNPVFNNPTVYTLTLDAAAQEMSTFRLDLLDFDTFEGITSLNPLPSRVEGDVTWNGSTITANVGNTTAYVYWDAPPATISYRYGNTGGGTACAAVRFQGTTLVPDGCCGCGTDEVVDTEVLTLCDTADDGTVTNFLRSLAFTTGDTTTVTDTALDGLTPYTVTGTVGLCQAEQACTDAYTQMLCDETVEVTWTQTSVVPDPAQPAGRGFIFTLSPADDPSVVGTINVLVDRANGSCGANYWPNGATFTYTLDSVAQSMETLRVNLEDFDPTESITMLTGGAPDRLGGNAYVAAGGVIRSNVNNAYGYMFFDSPPASLSYRFGGSCIGLNFNAVSRRTVQFLRKVVTDCETGAVVSVTDTTLDGQPYTVTGDVGDCSVGTGQCCPDSELLTLCDTATDGTVTGFLRHLVYPHGNGTPTATDTALDGVTAYVTTGTVAACSGEPETCRDSATVLLCDAPATSTVTVEPDVTDATGADVGQTQFQNLPGPYTSLWTGGALAYPADTGPAQRHRIATGRFTATPSGCDTATGTLTVSVRVTQNGPGTGQLWDGALRLFRGTTALATDDVALYAPPGHVQTLSASVPVTVAELAAGDLAVALMLETFHGTPKSWTADQFSATVELEGCEETKSVQFLRTLVTDCETGAVVSVSDATLDGGPYTVVGEVGQCEPTTSSECCPTLPPETRLGTETSPLCLIDDASGDVVGQVLAVRVWDDQTGGLLGQSFIDPVTSDTVTVPAGAHLGVCPGSGDEPCRDSSSTLLCDTAATDVITVFDPANVAGPDGWDVVSFTGANAGFGPETAMPYPAPNGAPFGYPAFGARTDQNAGAGGTWASYDAAPVRWVLRKTFTAPEDGVAVAESVGFRGDGGARVRINGVDAGMYGQWNQPATSGTAQVPVTAGPNTVEIEVRDTSGINNVRGRLDISMPRTVQFMRRQTVDCATGEVIATHDTTLDGDPYTVAGEVGQCEPVAECCEQAPPEQRVDVESELLCIRDEFSGDVLGQVVVERVYDDQSGDRLEQRLTDPTTGDAVELPVGAILARCPSPDRITRQICVVESGAAEFLTNAANATAGADTDWQWSPVLGGSWYPMYRVAPNTLWTVTDTAPNLAHWVSPHASKSVCSPDVATSPNVTATWYTRASWNLPANVSPDSIRIAASVLNADNDVVQWRLNDGAWQPVAGGGLTPPAWTITPSAVPGGRAGQNEIVVQITEAQPGVACPSPNQAGMLLHVLATYDYEPRVWTQVIEDNRVYYLDETGTRQDTIPAGQRVVACGGDGGCCPTEECGDTEIIQACDLVYSPEPPIAVPSSGFTTTGNVTTGGLLIFSSGDAAPNGVATRTLTGLLPSTGYELLFDSGWAGGGQPAPATTNAVYRAEILDGATVLGTRDRNLSNGSNTASGLTTDTPIQFLVPASGTITIRFTDLTTGNGVNRDLLIAPRTVQTQALTVTSVPFLRALTMDCAGAVTSVQDLALSGADAYVVQGVVGSCAGDGGGSAVAAGPDTEVLSLCDIAGDGTSIPFLRQLVFAADGTVTVTDTGLDGVTAYALAGSVGVCEPEAPARSDVELLAMCVVDNSTGSLVQKILAEVLYDTATGDRTVVRYVNPLTWGPVAMPGGTHVDVCPDADPEPEQDVEVLTLCDIAGDGTATPFLRHLLYTAGVLVPAVVDSALDGVTPYVPAGTVGTCPPGDPCPIHVIERCRCDDTDGDGIGDVDYVELLGVDCEGVVTTLGTYDVDLTAPYTPVAPVDCADSAEGADPVTGIQARRVELTAGGSWSAVAHPTLQSVTAIAHGGTGTVTTGDGPSTLHVGESATWSVSRDGDAFLTGPLVIAAGSGSVTVTWTVGVTL